MLQNSVCINFAKTGFHSIIWALKPFTFMVLNRFLVHSSKVTTPPLGQRADIIGFRLDRDYKSTFGPKVWGPAMPEK